MSAHQPGRYETELRLAVLPVRDGGVLSEMAVGWRTAIANLNQAERRINKAIRRLEDDEQLGDGARAAATRALRKMERYIEEERLVLGVTARQLDKASAAMEQAKEAVRALDAMTVPADPGEAPQPDPNAKPGDDPAPYIAKVKAHHDATVARNNALHEREVRAYQEMRHLEQVFHRAEERLREVHDMKVAPPAPVAPPPPVPPPTPPVIKYPPERPTKPEKPKPVWPPEPPPPPVWPPHPPGWPETTEPPPGWPPEPPENWPPDTEHEVDGPGTRPTTTVGGAGQSGVTVPNGLGAPAGLTAPGAGVSPGAAAGVGAPPMGAMGAPMGAGSMGAAGAGAATGARGAGAGRGAAAAPRGAMAGGMAGAGGSRGGAGAGRAGAGRGGAGTAGGRGAGGSGAGGRGAAAAGAGTAGSRGGRKSDQDRRDKRDVLATDDDWLDGDETGTGVLR